MTEFSYQYEDLREFVQNFGTVKCESDDELYNLVDILRSLGFTIGFDPHEYEGFWLVSLGSVKTSEIHSAKSRPMWPNNEVRLFSSFQTQSMKHEEKEFITLDIDALFRVG